MYILIISWVCISLSWEKITGIYSSRVMLKFNVNSSQISSLKHQLCLVAVFILVMFSINFQKAVLGASQGGPAARRPRPAGGNMACRRQSGMAPGTPGPWKVRASCRTCTPVEESKRQRGPAALVSGFGQYSFKGWTVLVDSRRNCKILRSVLMGVGNAVMSVVLVLVLSCENSAKLIKNMARENGGNRFPIH